MRIVGILILALGTIGLGLALSMDTTVSTGLGKVHNIGLMNQQQNYTIAAGAIMMLGVLIFLASMFAPRPEAGLNSPRTAAQRKCPACAELISEEAVKCKQCGTKVEPLAEGCGFCGTIVRRPAQPCAKSTAAELAVAEDRIKSDRCRAVLAELGVLRSQS